MSISQIFAEQYKKLPILVDANTSGGKTYIVTGGNSGLGLETARHLVRSEAARVVITARNLDAGEKAKVDIERSTGRKGVVEVWELDLGSYASVKAFASKVSSSLERIDAVVENAGVMLDRFELVEGNETGITVNVISTFLLAALLLPKLTESARQFAIKPRLVFVGSALGFQAQKELAKSGKTDLFRGFNDAKRADMDQRYDLTKLVELYAFREFANRFPYDRTGVIINIASPGLCSTGLAREARFALRAALSVTRAIMARTAEVGSRTILHGVVADEESHGKFLSGCQIKE